MKIAVTSQGEDLQAEVDPRFGRASNFLVIETDTMSLKVVRNGQSFDLPQGAGIQAAQNIVPHKPNVVLTGNCGPKAFKALRAAGIAVVVGVRGKVGNVVKAYLEGQYEPVNEPNVDGHWM